MVYKDQTCGNDSDNDDCNKPDKTQQQEFGCFDPQPKPPNIINNSVEYTHIILSRICLFEFNKFFYLNPASVEFAGDNLNSFKIVYAGFRYIIFIWIKSIFTI